MSLRETESEYVERLERENASLRRMVAALRENPGEQAEPRERENGSQSEERRIAGWTYKRGPFGLWTFMEQGAEEDGKVPYDFVPATLVLRPTQDQEREP